MVTSWRAITFQSWTFGPKTCFVFWKWIDRLWFLRVVSILIHPHFLLLLYEAILTAPINKYFSTKYFKTFETKSRHLPVAPRRARWSGQPRPGRPGSSWWWCGGTWSSSPWSPPSCSPTHPPGRWRTGRWCQPRRTGVHSTLDLNTGCRTVAENLETQETEHTLVLALNCSLDEKLRCSPFLLISPDIREFLIKCLSDRKI